MHGCHPAAAFCTLYLGVYGFLNSTYSLTVSVNEGFSSPIALIDEQPQSGDANLIFYPFILLNYLFLYIFKVLWSKDNINTTAI